MAKYLGSRMVGKFRRDAGATVPGTLITFGITGFSVTGGDRNMIDITTGADNRRFVFGGLAEPLTASINFIYQGEVTELDGSLTDCGEGRLLIETAVDDGSCDTFEIIGTDDGDETTWMPVYLTGFSIEGELDGAVTGTVNFTRVAEPPSSP